MLLGLLVRHRVKPSARSLARLPVARTHPDAPDAVLCAIARTIAEHGRDALTDPEKLIWNTAVVISFMTGDRRIGVPCDASVFNWGAARAGFLEMGLPTLAEFVKSLVIELAYRADLDARDRRANSASLLRIAELKRKFQAMEAEVDFPRELRQMIYRVYEWT